MNRVRVCTFGLLSASFCYPALAQTAVAVPGTDAAAKPAKMQFIYENPGVDPSEYWIDVDETGHGHYRSKPMVRKPDPDSAEMPTKSIDKDLDISPDTVAYLFTTARSRRFFAMSCEDGKGKIAFQGSKKLNYQGRDGSGECTYNWSKDQAIERLTRIFEGISLTVEAGGRLTMEHKHDLLGLDHDLGALATDFKEGRAAEIRTIASELTAIAEDEAVMERARTKAARLLQESPRVIE